MAQPQAQKKVVNGVDVGRLQETIQTVQEDPSKARFEFRARNHWTGGTHNRSEIKDFHGMGEEYNQRAQPFVYECDEPPALAGDDRAGNPVEYVLHALAGCVTTTMAAHAAARGIAIESIDSKLEGDIDLQGFFGLREDVPRGYQDIRVTMRVKSDADADQLAELARYSPVYNTISNPVRITLNIEKEA